MEDETQLLNSHTSSADDPGLLTEREKQNQAEHPAQCAAAASGLTNEANLIKFAHFFCCFTKYLFPPVNCCHQTVFIFLH